MRWIGLALMCACASSRSAEQHSAAVLSQTVTADEGPERVRTTVREYAPPVGRRRGPILKETVTLEERGPTKTTTATNAHLDAESASQSSFKLGLSLWTKLAMAAGLVALAWLGWRFRGKLLPHLFP